MLSPWALCGGPFFFNDTAATEIYTNENDEIVGIGVDAPTFTPSAGSVGIAFAKPASVVESVIPQLQKKGYVERGWLGVQIQPVTKPIAESLGLKEAAGALIAEPQPGSPAAKAGLKSGDVITAVGNSSVKDARDLAQRIAGIAPGTEVSLTIIRDGKSETVPVKIGQQQEPAAKKAPEHSSRGDQVEKLGLALAPADEVQGAGEEGVAVVGVQPGGKAAALGIAEGDIILKAGGKKVSTPSEFKEALQDAKAAGKSHALILLKHKKNELYVAVPVSAG